MINQWFLEKLRWQLYPIFFLILIVIVMLILNKFNVLELRKIFSKSMPKVIVLISAGVIIILSVLASYAFPLSKMPKLKGPNKVGTITFDSVDESRPAIYSEDESKSRKIRIQLWYPTDDTKGLKVVPWIQDGKKTAEGIADMMGIPGFVLSHTTKIKSNSYEDAIVSSSKERYPVVIISHGWTGFRNLHTDLAETLASNGFIAVAIDHTFGAAVTVFDNGDEALLNRNALPSVGTPDFLKYANTLVNTYSGDIKFTMNELNRLNNGEISLLLKDKIDLNSIGLLGHSTGGGAGVATALTDDRVKAVMGLDAWVEPIKEEQINKGLKVPGLFLRSQEWQDGKNDKNLYSLINSSKGYKELYQIDGSVHQDFTMAYMYTPLTRYLGITGKLDGLYGSEIQQAFMLKFFNSQLRKSQDNNMDEIKSKYNEVKKIK
jgi:hypothetical protein